LAQEVLEVRQRAVGGVHVHVVRDVVAVVPQRRGVEGQQPDGRDPQVAEIVELLAEPSEIADAVPGAVVEGPDVQLVDDGVPIPERVVVQRCRSGHQASAAISSRKRRTAHTWGKWKRAGDGPSPTWTVQASAGMRSERSSSVRSSPTAKRKRGAGVGPSRAASTSPLLAQISRTSTDFLPRTACSSVSASMASSTDTSSLASHSPNSGSAMRWCQTRPYSFSSTKLPGVRSTKCSSTGRTRAFQSTGM